MILYLDTSALVKLFVAEEHSQSVRQAVGDCRTAVTQTIAYCEAAAAFGRLARERGEPLLVSNLRTELDRHWVGWEIVAVTESLVRRAADLAAAHALRAYDSLHLATVEAVARAVGDAALLRFAVYDQPLAAAARTLGIVVL